MSEPAHDAARHAGPAFGLTIDWSPAYRSEWDATPDAYVAHGVVAWGRSRRLAKARDAAADFKAYLGIQHFDPGRWHVPGEPRAVYFLSLFLRNQTLALRTYAHLADALAALEHFHTQLVTD